MSMNTETKVIKVDNTNIHDLYQINKQLACDEGQKDLFSVRIEDYATAFMGDNPLMYGYLLYHEDMAIGFYSHHYKFATYTGKKVLYIEDMYVINEYADTINKQHLIEHAVMTAQQDNCCRVEIRMLKAFNIGYELADDNGFKPVDKWQVYRLENKS